MIKSLLLRIGVLLSAAAGGVTGALGAISFDLGNAFISYGLLFLISLSCYTLSCFLMNKFAEGYGE